MSRGTALSLFFPCCLVTLASACSDHPPVVGGGGDATFDRVEVHDLADIPPDEGLPSVDRGMPDALDEDALETDVVSVTDQPDAADAPPDGRGPCRDNTDCGSNEFGLRACDTESGMCVECTATMRSACRPGFFCSAANRCEAGCDEDTDCALDGGTFRCDTTRHVCVGCVRDDQCPAGQVCMGMNCVPGCNDRQTCPAGETCCAGTCRRTQTDVTHCGACGVACSLSNAAANCVAGRCAVATCNPSFGDCDSNPANGCEANLANDPSHCGACGNTCPTGSNAMPTCAMGRCGLRCAEGFGDCDGNPTNGCEANLANDPSRCGTCGTACAAGPNATATCAQGRCGTVCNPGFGDCDGNPANGCEANLANDPSRCGTCATVCAGGTNARAVCVSGVCQIECTSGFANCDGNTTNGCEAALDGTGSCGRCGVLCSGATPLCSMSASGYACASGCAPSETRCGASCADLQRDVSDCGACGNTCPMVPNAARTCMAGRCGFTCNPGFGDCDGNPSNGCEVFLNTDSNHCGACGRMCPTGPNATAVCSAGTCSLRCAMGFGDCDGNPTNGCEVDVRASATHCGVCGRACPGGVNGTAVCVASTCGIACNPGFADCDGNPANGCEVDTRSNVSHCGACGVVCPSGMCLDGRCGASATCQTLHASLPMLPSGVYTIDPDGPGGRDPMSVYCDMTSDGGGWTLVAYASRGSVSALTVDTGIRNLYSLATGGGTYDGLGRRGVASLPAVPIARRSREMLLSRSDTDFFTGPILGYDVVTKFTIPSPSTVNFLNSNPAVALPDRGPCVPVVLTTLRGPNATGATRYVFQNTLSVSWTDTYPTSYGVMDSSNCLNGSLGPNFASDYSGVGNLRSYPWPRAPDGAAHTYWHLGWWDPTRTSQTGSVAIWLR